MILRHVARVGRGIRMFPPKHIDPSRQAMNLARLFLPEERWSLLFGVSQYF